MDDSGEDLFGESTPLVVRSGQKQSIAGVGVGTACTVDIDPLFVSIGLSVTTHI